MIGCKALNELFNYELPAHLIAQQPCPHRDQSRLMVVSRERRELAQRQFFELPEILRPGDLLVLNDSRVLPARLLGSRKRRERKTGGKWEGLFLGQSADGIWELMCQTRGRLAPGEIIAVEPGPLELLLIARNLEGRWLAQPSVSGSPTELLQRFGRVPLPPYIRKGKAVEADRERYQTVYARQAGAVAAPTAGLHFTPHLFDKLRCRGIDWAFITLHVGPGTFLPIQGEDYTKHCMHAEWGELPDKTAQAINACRSRGGQVIAVGSTSVRVLETAATASGAVRPWSGDTGLFIYPPYSFRAVDALLTNFHLPRSTLLLLVAAFAGADLLSKAYKTAIDMEYRFFSYGDAMLIVS